MNLKALAEHLGLSQTTVSRALNGYSDVNEKTRSRVFEAAAKLGYRPNYAARRLATGKAGVIGYVLVTGAGVQADPHFMEFLTGMGEFATAKGIDIHIAPCPPEDESGAYRRLASTRQVDGIFVSSPVVQDPRIGLLREISLPFIVHGRSEGVSGQYSFLDIDNISAFRDATRLLLELGHRRIALINGERSATFAQHREIGMIKALSDAGLGQDPSLVSWAPMSEEHGYRSTISVLDSPEPPTALLCSSIIVALGAIRALGDRGIEVGKGMSVIAHDDVFAYLRPENFRVPLTCTRSPIRRAGYRIAERLAALIDGSEQPGLGEVWPVELVVRNSTARPL